MRERKLSGAHSKELLSMGRRSRAQHTKKKQNTKDCLSVHNSCSEKTISSEWFIVSSGGERNSDKWLLACSATFINGNAFIICSLNGRYSSVITGLVNVPSERDSWWISSLIFRKACSRDAAARVDGLVSVSLEAWPEVECGKRNENF